MWEVQFWEFNLRREQLMEKLCIIYLKILKKNLTALFNLKNYEVLSQNFHQKRLKTEFQILFLETEKYFQNIEEDLPLNSAEHRAAQNAPKLHNFQFELLRTKRFKIDNHM